MFNRSVVFLYGIACYFVSLATFVYLAGFLVNLYVPRSMDSAADGDLGTSVFVDLLLVLLFSLQHSVMARPGFKRWWTKLVPEAAERSTYLLASDLALIVLFVYWRPLGGNIWSVQGTAASVLYGIYALGWALLLASTFFIDHFDLFGLRQIWRNLLAKDCQPVGFRLSGPYHLVRHPIYVGWLTIFWATPTMTVTHLLFATAVSVYIFVAIQFEERDLVDSLGDAYREYRQKVPMLIPFAPVKGGRGD